MNSHFAEPSGHYRFCRRFPIRHFVPEAGREYPFKPPVQAAFSAKSRKNSLPRAGCRQLKFHRQHAILGRVKRYFAYGSNMLKEWMMEDKGVVSPHSGKAELPGYKFTFNKPSTSNSSKGNIVESEEERVYGLIFEVTDEEWRELAKREVGYHAVQVTITLPDGGKEQVETFVADKTIDDLPFDWYRDLIVEGAIQTGQPAHYIESLRAFKAKEDTGQNQGRHSKAKKALAKARGQRAN